MCKRAFFLAVLLLSLSLVPALAQDPGVPDTVYYGDQGKAYGYPGGIFKVPIYVVNDDLVAAFSIGIEYGLGDLSPTFDSVGTYGTVWTDPNLFGLTGLIVVDGSVNGVMPDSVLLGGAAFPGQELPAGRHHFCDIWFTGGNPSEEFTVDSAWVPPAGSFIFQSPTGGGYVPQFVGGTLIIDFGPPLIFLTVPDSVVGDAATTISFEVSATAAYPPAAIVYDSLINVSTGDPATSIPDISGANPLLFEWQPTYDEYGTWNAWFTACDLTESCLEFSVEITVNWVQPPCDVMRGDADCNLIVNVSDVVYLVNYIFGQGPPPGCEEE